MATSSIGRIKGFDGIRGLAALLVVVHHTWLLDTHLGTTSVNAFFELSGFLIFGILARRRRAIEAGTSSFTRELLLFWRDRALRIFPVYYLTLFALLLLSVFLSAFHDVRDNILWYLLYLQNFFIAFASHQWGPFTQTWSLAVEQQFYLIAGIAFLLIPTHRFMRAFLISFLICLLAALALRFTLQGIAPGVLPFEGFMFVIAGGAAALWPERLLHKIRIGENAAARLAWLLFAAILILAILPVSPVRTLWSPALPLPTWLITLLLTGLIALFLRTVASFPNLLLVRLFEAPPMIWLGSISYALYVFHVPVALIMAKALDRCACAQGWLFPLTLAVSAVLSHLSREFVERPMAKLKAGRRIAPAQPSGQLP